MIKNKGIKILLIVLLILLTASVLSTKPINNAIKKMREISSKYELEELMQIMQSNIEQIVEKEQSLGNEITIENLLQELLDNKTFTTINKAENTGLTQENEVKLKYNEENQIEIEYIQPLEEERTEYYLYPSSYTNQKKVEISFHTTEKLKSITKPDGLIIYPQTSEIWIDYTVTKNGIYKFKIEKEDGTEEEKQVIVDTIDTLPPKVFDIEVTSPEYWKIEINGRTEDEQANELNIESGIDHYEYWIKHENETSFTKYLENVINVIYAGTYDVYCVVIDKAGNSTKTNTHKVNVEANDIEVFEYARENSLTITDLGIKKIGSSERNFFSIGQIGAQSWTGSGYYLTDFEVDLDRINFSNIDFDEVRIDFVLGGDAAYNNAKSYGKVWVYFSDNSSKMAECSASGFYPQFTGGSCKKSININFKDEKETKTPNKLKIRTGGTDPDYGGSYSYATKIYLVKRY